MRYTYTALDYIPKPSDILTAITLVFGLWLIFFTGAGYGADSHRCAGEAKLQAAKLLAFHFGSDDRIEIEKNVKLLPAIRNPAKKKQLFDVLEIWGNIYKGQYRLRFIYARLPGECVLMGQEILEYASL